MKKIGMSYISRCINEDTLIVHRHDFVHAQLIRFFSVTDQIFF